MHTGYTVNVSESGLLVYLPEKLMAGQKLKVKFYFNIGSTLNNIEAIAEIVWVSLLETVDKEYLCGLKFIGISPEDLNKLKRFLGNLA